MQKYIVEATSRVSMAEAAIMAMAKAATYLSENHDIKISVLEMAAIKGVGYRVVLEVTLIPLGRGETIISDSKNPEAEARSAIPAKDQERRQATDTGIKRRIMEHFRKRRGTFIETPSVHLAQLTEDMLLGHITTEFMQKEQPVNLGPLNDPLAVQKAAPAAAAAGEAIEDFQNATHPEGDASPVAGPAEKKPGGRPQADPD